MPSFQKFFFLPLLAASVLGSACGDGEPSQLVLMPPSISSCQFGWQPMTKPRTPYMPPRALRYRDGELIYFACDDLVCNLEAYPLQGGAPRVVATDVSVWDLWLEGDEVLFAYGANLWQVPVSGGKPTRLITDLSPGQSIYAHALTATALIWSNMAWDDAAGQITDEIWSAQRDGSGTPTLLTNIGSAGVVQQMEVVGDSLLVAGQGATGAVVPLSGGAHRILGSAGYWYVGADSRGVYGTTQTGNSFAMHVAPIDGGPSHPFWSSMPPYGTVEHIWADKNGGWFAVVSELFDDAKLHHSAFFIDSQQNATRVACLHDSTVLEVIDGLPAFTDEAAYIVGQNVTNPESASWQIIRIPRPEAQRSAPPWFGAPSSDAGN